MRPRDTPITLALDETQWTRHEGGGRTLHLRGRLHDGARLWSTPEVAAHLAAVDDLDGLARALDVLDGFFALVLEPGEGRVLAAVDRTRSLPLFFGRRAGRWRLSDDAYAIAGEDPSPASFDPRAVDEFLITSYVTGRRTLHPAVSQLQSGEALALAPDDAAPRFSRYYRYGFLPPVRTESPAVLRDELDALAESAVRRLIELADGRTLAIPLSGGRDSRLLALMLRRLGYDDVVTFTYGKPGNAEALVSEQVAAGLGLRWHFVPYDEASWRRWFDSDAMRRFYRMADGLTSVPHVMDWPAVGELTRRGVLRPGEVVVVPGHSADLPAGSRSLYVPDIYREGCRSVEALVAAVINYHYCLYDWSARRGELLPGYRAHILEVLDGLGGVEALDAVGRAFESWDWQERQARLIVNSVRVYEFWGHAWWMPWWDRAFIDFFARIPMRLKQNKRFYDDFVDDIAAAEGLRLKSQARVVGADLRRGARQLVRRHPETFRAARWLVRAVRRRRWQGLYASHPMGWYGFVPPQVFAANFTGRESILAFMALERVGRISLRGERQG